MGKVWCVGISPNDPRLIGIEGVNFHSTVKGCDTLLLATNKNGLDGISALEHNVQMMHESLATASAKGLHRMVVLGNTSSLEGRRWKVHAESWDSTMGVSVNSIHGMGQLIVEVLARSAALKGMQVVLIRVGLAPESHINRHLARAFTHSSASLESFKNSKVPDLDAWIAMCLDESGEFNSDISPEQWAPSRED